VTNRRSGQIPIYATTGIEKPSSLTEGREDHGQYRRGYSTPAPALHNIRRRSSMQSEGQTWYPNTLGTRVPKYDGTTDLDLFFSDFLAHTELYGLGKDEAYVVIKASLVGIATPCRRGRDFDDVVEHLQNRFGLSARDAARRLSTMEQGTMDFHTLADEIDRLALKVYGKSHQDQGVEERKINTFLEALSDSNLRNLVTIARPRTLMEATLQAVQLTRGVAKKGSTRPATVAPMGVVRNTQAEHCPNDLLLQRIVELEEKLKKLESTGVSAERTSSTKPPSICYFCQKPGHIKKYCRQFKAKKEAEKSGVPVQEPINPATEKSKN